MKIIKGIESLNLEKFFSDKNRQNLELEERMHKMGHFDFIIRCRHSLTTDRPNPEGPIMKTFCIICGKELA